MLAGADWWRLGCDLLFPLLLLLLLLSRMFMSLLASCWCAEERDDGTEAVAPAVMADDEGCVALFPQTSNNSWVSDVSLLTSGGTTHKNVPARPDFIGLILIRKRRQDEDVEIGSE
jgi:hypothetical protein